MMNDNERFNDDGRYEPPPLGWLGILAWLGAGVGVVVLILAALWLV